MSITAAERAGAVSFRGKPMTLVGSELRVGDLAPDFALTGEGLARVTLDDATAHGTRPALLIVFPSLDTPTCSLETLTFQKRAGELPAGVATYIVSNDLPFAQARWAGANGADAFTYLSNYNEPNFGPAYGVLIKEIGLLARALFVVAADHRISYVQVVPEVASEPNYDAFLNAAAKA